MTETLFCLISDKCNAATPKNSESWNHSFLFCAGIIVSTDLYCELFGQNPQIRINTKLSAGLPWWPSPIEGHCKSNGGWWALIFRHYWKNVQHEIWIGLWVATKKFSMVFYRNFFARLWKLYLWINEELELPKSKVFTYDELSRHPNLIRFLRDKCITRTILSSKPLPKGKIFPSNKVGAM